MAQVVESSNCLDFMEEEEYKGEHGLYMSVTMPAIEVGTIGGGTSLTPQHACIDLMAVGTLQNVVNKINNIIFKLYIIFLTNVFTFL